MHEFSICESLVEGLVAEMKKINPPPQRLLRTRVVVGGLRQVVPEYLQEAYEILTRDTPAAGSVLEIRSAPIVGKCRDCGWQGDVENVLFECGACGSYKIELVGGTELYIESIDDTQVSQPCDWYNGPNC